MPEYQASEVTGPTIQIHQASATAAGEGSDAWCTQPAETTTCQTVRTVTGTMSRRTSRTMRPVAAGQDGGTSQTPDRAKGKAYRPLHADSPLGFAVGPRSAGRFPARWAPRTQVYPMGQPGQARPPAPRSPWGGRHEGRWQLERVKGFGVQGSGEEAARPSSPCGCPIATMHQNSGE